LPLANSFGWNNADVTVTWSCSDIVGVLSASVSETVSTEGLNQSVTGTCEDTSGNTASDTQSGISIDKTPPTLAPSVSPNPVVLNGSATASPNASDALSGLASASCGTVVTSSAGSFAVNCTATDKAGNSTNAPANYTVSYAVCPLYDMTKSHKLGSTVPVKLQLCDANGVNKSSASIVVHAATLTRMDTSASGVLDDSGAANSPTLNFRYDATLGGSGGYIFNLSTKGLSRGTWKLTFTVDDVSNLSYAVYFDVK